jgi:multidrug efflux system outer membrane protein
MAANCARGVGPGAVVFHSWPSPLKPPMLRLFILSLALLLSACSQTAEFHRPPPPVPQVWPIASERGASEAAAKIHWRRYFPDPRLQALIALALENNRDLRIAAARVEEARAQYGVARADRLPSAYFGSESSMSIISSSYEFDFWGRVSGMTESARVSFLASEEARQAVHLSLVADVAGTYFSLLQEEEQVALSQATTELREQSLALIRKGRDLGGTYEFEVQQATGALEASRGLLSSRQHQRAVAANKLNFLVGQVVSTLPQGLALDDQGLDADIAPGVPSEVLLTRPDVIAAEQRLQAAHANIGVARTAFFPKILISSGFGVATAGVTALAGGGAWYFAPVLSSMPLFDNGRTAANVDVAQSRKVGAVAEYERTIQLAFREVADLLSARTSLAHQLRAAKAGSNAQETRLHIAQARHKAGLISYLEVLDAQRELLSAQQGVIQLRRTQLDSAAQLYKALGGGGEQHTKEVNS